MHKAIAIKNFQYATLGNLEAVLKHNQFSIEYVDAEHCDYDTITAHNPDLFIILGGIIGAYEEDTHPFLKTQIKLIQSRLASDLPILGICLGAQLIARALGAKVYPGDNFEIGWYPLNINSNGIEAGLDVLSDNSIKIMQWHKDTFELPKEATLLASSDMYQNQIFQVGERCLGIQAHPEITGEMLDLWFSKALKENDGITAEKRLAINEDTQKYLNILQPKIRKFWDLWLKAITEDPGEP